MFREVVIDNKRVAARVHKVLANSCTSKRREVLHRSWRRSAGVDNNRVLHRASLFKLGNEARGLTFFLADRHVDANRTRFFRLGFLVENGVYGNSCLAGVPVANNKLALTATDRDHRVDSFDAGVQWLID